MDSLKHNLFKPETAAKHILNHPSAVYYFAETELGLFTGADIFKEGSWLYPGAEIPVLPW
jgi:hypothetical protein